MVKVYDVETDELIKETAKKLMEMGLKKPDFVGLVKSGSHTERPPEQEDFWWIRVASVLRKVYISGNIGVNKLRRQYGGRKKFGIKPAHFRLAGGKTNRVALQELEKLKLIKKGENGKGRVITGAGEKLLDSVAFSMKKSKGAE